MQKSDTIKALVTELQRYDLPVAYANPVNREELITDLAAYINTLITNDFSRLVALLYRLDISEKKLKDLLAIQKNTHAGLIIATLIIDRQLQKIESRKKYKMNERDIPEDEKW